MNIADLHDLKVLCIGAHADDIELFASGLVMQLVRQSCSVWCQVVTSIADCNPIHDDPPAESLRQQKRQRAFLDSCRLLGAWPLPNWELGNARNANGEADQVSWQLANKLCDHDLIRTSADYHLLITHGLDGESGHLQHKIVAATIRRYVQIPLLTFSATGSIVVQVDVAEKRKVLGCYKYGTTRTLEWNPTIESNPDLAPWLGSEERFDVWPTK